MAARQRHDRTFENRTPTIPLGSDGRSIRETDRLGYRMSDVGRNGRFRELFDADKSGSDADSSPLDVTLTDCTRVNIPPITWSGVDAAPLEMTVRNTGKTLNVDAEYSGRRPSVNGVLLRCPYEFWCFHFHWDDDDGRGVTGKRFPMEIHLVFYNASYLNTDEALDAEDGILILVFVCRLADDENPTLRDLTSSLDKVGRPGNSTAISPFALSRLFDGDLENYHFCWDENDGNDDNPILWVISSRPVSVSESQLSGVRSLRGTDGKHVGSNRRPSGTVRPRKLFAVNNGPAGSLLRNADDDDNDDNVVGPTNDPDGTIRAATEPNVRLGPETDAATDGSGTAKTGAANGPSAVSSRSVVLRSIDRLISDLGVRPKKRPASNPRRTEQTRRDGVRMTSTALKREKHIKDRLQKQAALNKT